MKINGSSGRKKDLTRTLLVGLDAACWEYVDPLLKSGRLPNLAALMAKGNHGKLTSVMPPITPAAWSSLATGVNPGKHGVFEWVQRRSDDYQVVPVTSQQRVGTAVWERLNQAGLRTGVVNIPLTHPVKPVVGFLLCGFGVPASQRDLTFPHELLSEIEERYGAYQPDIKMSAQRAASPAAYQKEREHQARLVRIAAYLAAAKQVDVLIINLMLLDHANHIMPDLDIVEDAIVDSDADLGILLSEFSPDNVMLISDHGSRRVEGVFLLSAWLAEQGFLERVPSTPSHRAEALSYLIYEWRNGGGKIQARLRRRLLREMMLRMPGALIEEKWLDLETVIPLAKMQALTLDRFNPQNTRIYSLKSHRGNLYLNLAGREPQGSVSEQEKEAVLELLTAELSRVVDPVTGEALFSKLYRPREIYSGPFTENAPDLTGDYYASKWSVATNLPGLRRRSWRYFLNGERWYGDHSTEGIYLFAGTAFKNQPQRGQAHLLDIPATLLYLHGVPVPEDYDGRPLTETFRPEHLENTPVHFQPGDVREPARAASMGTLAGEEELVARLSALGYLEE
jgi:predicted AlkP superfamily phosphohydrolase/phosphomutase